MTKIDEIDFLHVSYLFLEISEGLLLPPTPYLFLEIPEGLLPPHSLPIPGTTGGGSSPPSLLTYSWNYRWGLLPPCLLLVPVSRQVIDSNSQEHVQQDKVAADEQD